MKVRGRIGYAVRDGEVYLHGWIDGDVRFVKSPLLPYAFADSSRSDVLNGLREVVKVEKTDLRNIHGERVVRFDVAEPKAVPKVRKKVGYDYTHEADIPFVRRLLIDRVLEASYGDGAIVYVDIEVDDSEGFPRPGERIISIAYSGVGEKTKFLYAVDGEEEAIRRFLDDTVLRGKLVMVAWNVRFDYWYLLERARKLGLEREARLLERFELIDLLGAYKGAVKGLSSYSLLEVARKEKLSGVDVKAREKMVSEMDLEELERYNVGDVELIKEIDDRYGFTRVATRLAEYVGLTLSHAFYAEMLKEEDKIEYKPRATAVGDVLLIRRARELGYVLPNVPKTKKKGYPGAYVHEPVPGFYRRVGVYDYASMYPNIIVNYKIDVLGFKGELLPYLEAKLLKLRAEYKKLAKIYGDKEYDVQQRALKLLANSLYGLAGTNGSRYMDEKIAAEVTKRGRELILGTIKRAEEEWGKGVVVYADSVTGDSKIIYMTTDSVSHGDILPLAEGVKVATSTGITEISSLFKEVTERVGEKEYYVPNEAIYTLAFDTRTGKLVWGRIKYVMRHKISKKIYKVCATSEVCVKVTEDHSLIIRQNVLSQRRCRYGCGEYVEVTPERLLREKKKTNRLGASLIVPSRLEYKVESLGMPEKFYEFLGFFLADGSKAVREADKRLKRLYYIHLSLGRDEEELVDRLLEPLKEAGLISNYYRGKKGDYTVLVTPIEEYLKRFYDDFTRSGARKKIPEFIFKEKPENIAAFLRGYFTGDGTVMVRNGNSIIRASSIDREVAFGIMRLLLQIGIPASVFRGNTVNKYNDRVSGTYNYYVVVGDCRRFAEKVRFLVSRKNARLTCPGEPLKKISDDIWLKQIASIEEVDCDGYVYDIEVDGVHNFFADWILVHNTDSVFVNLDVAREDPRDIEAKINSWIAPFRVKLEYLGALLIQKKKRYILVTEDGEWVVKGIELRRGDWDAFTKMVVEKVAKMIFEGKSYEEIKRWLTVVKRELYEGKYDEMLVITKTIDPRKKYKNEAEHVRAWRLLGAPTTVDRVHYVYVRGKDRVYPLEKPEDIVRVRDKIRLDYRRYWDRVDAAVKRLIDPIKRGSFFSSSPEAGRLLHEKGGE